jgi:hypothetical protein
VSVEQRIFEAKNAYYQSLYESQRGWHTAEHTIWPWTTFLIQILDGAYEDFEQRVELRDAGEISSTGKGSGARWHRKGR